MEPEVELNSPDNPLAQRKARREAVAEQAAEVKSAELEEEKAYQEAREAELGQTLTLEDINRSLYVTKLGVCRVIASRMVNLSVSILVTKML
jgi:hypothetical protein